MDRERPDIATLNNIERNYAGNDSELMFSRLHNEEVKKQVVDLMYRLGRYDEKRGKVIGPNGESEWVVKPNAPTYEECESNYAASLDKLERVTWIELDPEKMNCQDYMSINAINPTSGERYTEKQLSVIEAHEKGHVIRDFYGKPFDEYFRSGFDIHDDVYTEEVIWETKKILSPTSPEEFPDDIVLYELNDYLFSGKEIVERMNQLKNYFGFRGTEKFTKQHLDIAREHYVSDVGFDNLMTSFFRAITPETEERFLELINNSGI